MTETSEKPAILTPYQVKKDTGIKSSWNASLNILADYKALNEHAKTLTGNEKAPEWNPPVIEVEEIDSNDLPFTPIDVQLLNEHMNSKEPKNTAASSTSLEELLDRLTKDKDGSTM